MTSPSISICPSISEISSSEWDALRHGPSPFLRHGFLEALEVTQSIGAGSGWLPLYVTAREGGELVGAVPAFVKTDSYGEYIFDWGWARAAHNAGVEYYPKLVVAAPVTPATGNRVLLAENADRETVSDALIAGVMAIAERVEASSVHWLFCTEEESALLAERGFSPRTTYQFHWHNSDYSDFETFLSSLKSRKRKQLRKERQRACEAVDSIDFVPGEELTSADLDAIDRYYRGTVHNHGGIDYLRPGFFAELHKRMPDPLLFARARVGGETVAGAIYLQTQHALYGRYWGAEVESEFLHFEIAYYRGIEYCIERGIPLFEAGAQGEHKLLRGFRPSATYSAHWIRDPDLDRAIRRFLAEETLNTRHRMAQLSAYLPYREGE